MSDLIWLSEAQMRRIELYFPLSHGVPLVDNCRVISGIIFVIRNGLRGRDALWLTARRIRSTIASSAGAEWACSTRSSRHWQRRAASPIS
jgi:transposase